MEHWGQHHENNNNKNIQNVKKRITREMWLAERTQDNNQYVTFNPIKDTRLRTASPKTIGVYIDHDVPYKI